MDPSSDDLVTESTKTVPSDLATPPDQMRNDALAEKRVSNAGFLQEAMDFTLNFLSASSNEKLVGVFALLTIVTYIVLGRVGLLLIGIVLGVILHASWEGAHGQGEEGLQLSKKRKELALEVSMRLLDWPKRVVSAEIDTQDNGNPVAAPEDLSATDLDYTTFRPATAAALRLLTDAVVKDYVK